MNEDRLPLETTVPAALRGRVRRGGDHWRIDLGPEDEGVPVLGMLALVGALLLVPWALFAWNSTQAVGLWPLAAVSAIVLLFGGTWLIERLRTGPEVLIVSARGLSMGHEAQERPSWLVLRGDVGGPIRLVGDHGWVFDLQPELDGPFRVDHLRWLARIIADQLQVPLRDELDTQAWARWELDRAYRDRVHWERRVAKSRAAFPAWYRKRPLEPQPVQHELEGPVYRGVMLERRGIRTPELGLAWANLLDVEMVVYMVRHGTEMQKRAKLLLRTRRGLLSMLDDRATHAHGAQLLWIRDQLREHKGHRPDHGSPEDVPQALRQVRRERGSQPRPVPGGRDAE